MDSITQDAFTFWLYTNAQAPWHLETPGVWTKIVTRSPRLGRPGLGSTTQSVLVVLAGPPTPPPPLPTQTPLCQGYECWSEVPTILHRLQLKITHLSGKREQPGMKAEPRGWQPGLLPCPRPLWCQLAVNGKGLSTDQKLWLSLNWDVARALDQRHAALVCASCPAKILQPLWDKVCNKKEVREDAQYTNKARYPMGVIALVMLTKCRLCMQFCVHNIHDF